MTAVMTHHLHHKCTLVTGRSARDGVKRLRDAVKRRVRTYRQVRSKHIIVNRTHQTCHRKKSVLFSDRGIQASFRHQLLQQRAPLSPQDLRAGQTAVAADHNQPVYTLEKQIAHRLLTSLPFEKARTSGCPQ